MVYGRRQYNNYIRSWWSFCRLYINPTADIPLPTVHLLVKELKEVKSWYMFGVALDIPVSELKAIQSSNPQDGVERWLADMFDYWLKSNTDASWKKIVQVLEDTEQHALAARVKQKYVSPPAPASTVGKRGVLVYDSQFCELYISQSNKT